MPILRIDMQVAVPEITASGAVETDIVRWVRKPLLVLKRAESYVVKMRNLTYCQILPSCLNCGPDHFGLSVRHQRKGQNFTGNHGN